MEGTPVLVGVAGGQVPLPRRERPLLHSDLTLVITAVGHGVTIRRSHTAVVGQEGIEPSTEGL